MLFVLPLGTQQHYGEPRHDADGQRFLVNSLPEQQESPRLELIVNWPALLRQ
jgi:hypothetical protein